MHIESVRGGSRMNSKEMGTEKRHQIVNYVKSYIEKHGYAPSFQEIGEGVNLSSKATVCRHIQRLIDEGRLETDNPGSPRALRVGRRCV